MRDIQGIIDTRVLLYGAALRNVVLFLADIVGSGGGRLSGVRGSGHVFAGW